MRVMLTLVDRALPVPAPKRREVNFLMEEWQRSPRAAIRRWIAERGNDQHSTNLHRADLQCKAFEEIGW